MVKQRGKKLVPRSFLPTQTLDRVLANESRKRGMTLSQLIRQALIEWCLYQGIEEAKQARKAGKL